MSARPPIHFDLPARVDEVTLAVLSAEVWVFRWIVNRMPVLGSAVELVREPARAPQPHAPAA